MSGFNFLSKLKQQTLFMQEAIKQAKLADKINEVPIGAVAVLGDQIIAVGHNLTITNLDPSAHAEIIAIRRAAMYLNNYRLVDVSLYVTLEPCVMCVGALLQARIKHLIFGARDLKFGAIGGYIDLNNYSWNHKFEVTSNILEPECRKILQDFFKNKRT